MIHIMDKIQITLMAAPLILIFLVLAAISQMTLEDSLSTAEKKLLSCTAASIKKSIKRQTLTLSALPSPIEISHPEIRDFPGTPLARIVPQVESDSMPPFRISMIMIMEDKKTAIINDNVMKEGDTIDSAKILKIEKDKILILDGKERIWVRIEQ